MEPQWHEAGRVVSLISLKWALSVMRALEQQPLRHSDLQRAIPGIGPTALGDTLRRMEAVGLIAVSHPGAATGRRSAGSALSRR